MLCNKEIKTKALICWLLTALWMGVIFYFSALQSDESSAQSAGLIRTIAPIINRNFEFLDAIGKSQFIESLQHIVRKIAHFLEYFVLGVLLSIAVGNHIRVWWSRFAVSLGIGAMYAVSDEIHQLFVDGRAGRVTDVLIDSAGVAVGAAVVVLTVAAITTMKKQ